MRRAQDKGIDVQGPFSADSIIEETRRSGACAIVSMYHDQVLPALKALSFGKVVNVTLGLPVTRVSVDHGTAYDCARSTTPAHAGSMLLAIERAVRLAPFVSL